VLLAIGEVWVKSPDLRLGQLLINAVCPAEPCPEVFSIEDRDLVRRLRGQGAEGEAELTVARERQLLPAPPGIPRVETGAVQFGDDWPGLFLRGDNALPLMIWIRSLCELLANHPDPMVADRLDRLKAYADLIEKTVKA
jgi:hypothetical protein